MTGINWHSKECYICFTEFGNKCARVNATNCMHSLCLKCWKESVKTTLKCPYCRSAEPTSNALTYTEMTTTRTGFGDILWYFKGAPKKLVRDQHQINLNRMSGLTERKVLIPSYNPRFIEDMAVKDFIWKSKGMWKWSD